MTKKQQASIIAAKTADAYMADSYGKEWVKVSRFLFSICYGEREVEAILRSKYMRWASDYNGGKCTLAGFKRFHASQLNARNPLFSERAIKQLVDETFEGVD